MSKRSRRAKRKRRQRSAPASSGNPSSSAKPAQPSEEITLVQLSEGLEQAFSETDLPMPTSFKDRKRLEDLLAHAKQNQIDISTILANELERIKQEKEAAAGREGAQGEAADVLAAEIRHLDETRNAATRNSDERRWLEIEITRKVTDRQLDRLDRADNRLDRAEDREDTRAKSEFWREAVVMGLSIGTFILAGILILVGISGEHTIAYFFSILSALCSAGGLRSLFVAHKRRPDRKSEAEDGPEGS